MKRLIADGNPGVLKRIDVDGKLSLTGFLGRHSGQLAAIGWHLIRIQFIGNPVVSTYPANSTATNRSPLIDWAAIGDANLNR